MTKLSAGVLIAMTSLAGCATSDPDVDIAATPLAGSVGGTPWTFRTGSTDAFLSEGDDNFFASFYATSYDPCIDREPTGPHLLVGVPKQPGDYELGFGLGRSMTFVVASGSNLVSFDGRIVVDAVTATTVTGGLHGIYDGNNEVDGRFEISICPEDDFAR